MQWHSEIVSQDALIIYFGPPDTTTAMLEDIRFLPGLVKLLQQTFQHRLVDTVPSYASVLLHFNVAASTILQRQQEVDLFLQRFDFTANSVTPQAKHVDIPVYYHAETGPDLLRLAKEKCLSQEQLIARHSEIPYTIYALGFAPGFAYMGFVDEQLTSPRLPKPRTKVAKGSVGIADRQTGIYPIASPGGWNIIGRTPLSLIQHKNEDQNEAQTTCLFQVGDTVKFRAITREEFLSLGGELKGGELRGGELTGREKRDGELDDQ